MTIGQKIHKLRKEKKLTQEKLGKMIGGDGRQISLYESGKTVPSTEALINLSEVFAVTVDYLVKDDVKNIATKRIHNLSLLKQFEQIEQMDKKDREIIKTLIDAFLAKQQIQKIIG